eukprot:2719914-Rhodomonas_salina.2
MVRPLRACKGERTVTSEPTSSGNLALERRGVPEIQGPFFSFAQPYTKLTAAEMKNNRHRDQSSAGHQTGSHSERRFFRLGKARQARCRPRTRSPPRPKAYPSVKMSLCLEC